MVEVDSSKARGHAMNAFIIHFVVIVSFGTFLSGCCVSHSLRIKNNAGAFVTLAAKDTGQGIGIPSGEKRDVPFWGGPMVVIIGSNMWFYPTIAYEEHPEARRRVFRFGICQAGFGYFVTDAMLQPNGLLTVGSGAYEPERKSQW